MKTSFYDVLGVAQNATTEQIRSRFLEMARRMHPDRFPAQEKAQAETEFQKVTEAFNVLTDPDRRREHDVLLARPASTGPDPKQAARVYMQRGVKEYRDGNFSAAAENFLRATKESPQEAKPWYHLALACSKQEQFLERGLQAVRRACELDQMNVTYYKLAGVLFQRAGQAEEATRYYNAALKWGDDDPSIREALQQLSGGARKGGLARLFGRDT